MSLKEGQIIDSVSIDDVYKLILNVNNNITSKIEALEKNVREISEKVDVEIVSLKSKVQKLEKDNQELQKELIRIKRNTKKNNIVLYGVREDTEENVQEKILLLLRDQLSVQIDDSEINNTVRLGKQTNNIRPILVEFVTYKRKKEIFNKRRNLKGTSVYISEDLIWEDREERKILLKQLKIARSKNRSAKLSGNRLIIDGVLYSKDDFEKGNIALNGVRDGTLHSHRQALGINQEENSVAQEEAIAIANRDVTEQICIHEKSTGTIPKKNTIQMVNRNTRSNKNTSSNK